MPHGTRKKTGIALCVCGLLPLIAGATENLPRIPFAESSRLPESNQLVVVPWYYYTVFRKLWIGSTETSIEVLPKEDFELNDGMVRFDYGLNKDFALDATFGYTSAATRILDPQRRPQTTQGLMDTQLGVRYRILDEGETKRWYEPTLTARLGAIITGTYDAKFPIAPGDGASGVEASVMMRKTFEPSGLGVYGEFGYRLRDHRVPHTIFGTGGLSETIKMNWAVNSLTIYAGYRGLTGLNGTDLTATRVSGTTSDYINIGYSPTAKEMYQIGEVGLAMTDRQGRRYFFSCGSPFDGQNTGKVNNFIIGLEWPLETK